MGTSKTWLVPLILGSLLLGGELLFNIFVPAPAPAVKIPSGATVAGLVGQVEIRRRGAEAWEQASLGLKLAEGDEIRTAQFSEANLSVSGGSALSVGANTSFVIGTEVPKELSFELAVGQIDANIPQDAGRQYLFRSRGSDALAAAEQGDFQLSTDGRGQVTLDTRRGEVSFSAAGKSLRLGKGQRSTVAPGKSPSPAMPIPSSIALQVRWPPSKLDRTSARVTGKTAAGSVVMINGIVVRADNEGNFVAEVPLREGSNRLVVSTTDNAGNTAVQESGEVQVNTRPPRLQIEAKDPWK